MSRLPCPPELWPEFSRLLDQALDLPEAARAAWLEGLGSEQATLKPLLARVLAGAAQLATDQFQAGAQTPAESEFHIGQPIGPYLLQRPLGQGGMGEVWLAVRGDGSLKRPVALKLPHAHLLAGSARRRFERERDILAGLTHAGIARLYDAGISDGGYPYLVMEWVEGEPLTRYCEQAQCSVDQRLGLFRQILEAVHHAHMRFVAHRDLKPSNILVTAQGQVKLLDFGVAKLLAGDESVALTGLTRLDERLLTPDYAAPEQLAGGTVTTASDVYALGVVLFELLTGQRPFDAARQRRGDDAPTASSRIAETAPPRCGLDARGLRRALRGDLDAIIAKAMAADPARRYPTALDFAADLQRYAAHQPIAARRVARLVLAGKFLRRHRLAALAAAALLLSIGAGIGGVAWQARLAQREARREAAVKNFLIGVFKASDPRLAADKPRDQVTARDLLDIGAQRADNGFFGDADSQIELLGILGEIYYELDDKKRFETLHRRQLQLAEARYGKDNPTAIDGRLMEAEIADVEGDYDVAQTLLDSADQAMRATGGTPVQRAQWWFIRAMALRADAKADASRRQALYNAIRLYARNAPADDNYPAALAELAFYFYNEEGELKLSARYYRAAIAAWDRVDKPDRSDQAEAYVNLANMLSQLGELDEAEQAYTHGLDLLRRTYGEHNPFYWIPVANYAQLVHWRGDRQRAWQLFDQLRADIPADSATTYDAVLTGEMAANCLAAEGRAQQAVPLLEAAERNYIDKPLQAADLRRVHYRLGNAYALVGRPADARRELKQALDAFVAARPPGNFQLLWIRERWGRFLLSQDDRAGAEEQFREVARWLGVRDQGQLYVALANGGLARLDLLRHDSAAALRDIRLAEQVLDGMRPVHDLRWGPYLWLIHAEALLQAGDAAAARTQAQRALDASRRYDDPASPSIAQAQALLLAAQASPAGATPAP